MRLGMTGGRGRSGVELYEVVIRRFHHIGFRSFAGGHHTAEVVQRLVFKFDAEEFRDLVFDQAGAKKNRRQTGNDVAFPDLEPPVLMCWLLPRLKW